jgi:hypothetical protein
MERMADLSASACSVQQHFCYMHVVLLAVTRWLWGLGLGFASGVAGM